METSIKKKDDVYKVLYDYKAQENDELTLVKGTRIKVLSKNYQDSGEDGWWVGHVNNKTGIFPCNYVCEILTEHNSINNSSGGTIKKKVVSEIPESSSGAVKLERCTVLRAASKTDEQKDSSSSKTGASGGKKETYKNEKINEFVRIEDIPHYAVGQDLKFEEFISSGGFSKVHRGLDLRNEKEVAIKDLQFNESNLEKIKQDFYQEAKLCWYLNHPNVIKLYGISVTESLRYCLVLEYAKGGSLRRLLSSRKNGLPPYVLIAWALQVAYGMLYLHEQADIQIIHRDLKSSNILLNDAVNDDNLDNIENIILKLSDFGLARETSNNNGGDIMTIAGTYSWMSPEVLKSAEYSKASDVWSFGVLLWELLTGEVPFDGFDHAGRIVYGIVGGLRLPIPSSCPEIFSNLLKNCWCDEPSKRLTFPQIIETLNEISNSTFASTPCDSFKMLQEDWKPEINEMFHEMYTEIKRRQAELYEKEEQLARIHNKLEQREKELEERERELIARELEVALQKHHQQPPEAKKRRNIKNHFNHFFRPHEKLKISSPTDFKHYLTVQPDQAQILFKSNNSGDDNQYSSNNNLSVNGAGSAGTLNSQLSVNAQSLPLGSPSLARLRVIVQQNNDTNDPYSKGCTFNQRIREKSQSQEHSSDNLAALLTPKSQRARQGRPKTPKQKTIWYHDDIRSNSLDSDTIFNEKSVDAFITSGVDSGLAASDSHHHQSRLNTYNSHISNTSSTSSNSNNNKRVNRLVYEIGSILAVFGLGKDYKKELGSCVGTKPPICSNKTRKSASPNTIRTNANKILTNSRDLTPPLSRVNKTFPYRFKASNVNKPKHHHFSKQQQQQLSTVSKIDGSISLQSSPKLSYLNDDLFNNVPSSPINRAKKQQSKSTILALSPSTTTSTGDINCQHTDDSGIYGDHRNGFGSSASGSQSKSTTPVMSSSVTVNRKVDNLTRPGTLNIKSALEKSSVFQKRKDLLTSSNSTEDDDHFNQESVINQLIHASNMMKEQMQRLISNTTATSTTTTVTTSTAAAANQKRTCNLFTPPAFSSNSSSHKHFFSNSSQLKTTTPNCDEHAFAKSKPNNGITYLNSAKQTPERNKNANDDDDDIQSTIL